MNTKDSRPACMSVLSILTNRQHMSYGEETVAMKDVPDLFDDLFLA